MTEKHLSTYIDDFIVARQAEGLADSTILSYSRVLHELVEFLNDPAPSEVTTDALRKFLVAYRRGRKPKTVYNAWTAIRSFWRYLEEKDIRNVARFLQPPKFPDPPVRVPTPEEVRRILDACEYTAPSNGRRKPFRMRRPTALRDRALIQLLVDTGMRLSEVVNLKVKDVDLSSGRILIRVAKAGKWRVVFITDPVKKALKDYWEDRGALPNEPAFVNRFSAPFTNNGIYNLIRRMGKRAGLEISPHDLRHFFATEYLRNGGDPFTLQRLLGHSTLTMVERYLRIIDDDLRKAHERASPLKSVLKVNQKEKA